VKPAVFEYHNPTTLSGALELLAQYGEEARALAGGQSLVPMMNFRLARPQHLIDLNRVSELSYIRLDGGKLRIGAMTRQRELERSNAVAKGWSLLADATSYIGHIQIRTRGTVGGSLAHAFPSAELPLVMTVLDAILRLRSISAERSVRAGDFFVGCMETELQPDELLVDIEVPPLPPGSGWAFEELSRRHGDFALMGVAGLLSLDEHGSIEEVRLGFSGEKPLRSSKAENLLNGQRPEENLFREAAAQAAQELDPDTDIHASGDYRRQVAEVLARRVLQKALTRASAV